MSATVTQTSFMCLTQLHSGLGVPPCFHGTSYNPKHNIFCPSLHNKFQEDQDHVKLSTNHVPQNLSMST